VRRALGLLLALLLAGAAAAPSARAADATTITWRESLRNETRGPGASGPNSTRSWMEYAYLVSIGPRLEVDNLNVLPQNPYTAPYEELRLRAR
jgi:hypothetical protein